MSDEIKVECDGEHTTYQPTDAEFKCLKCGAKPDSEPHGFYIDEPDEAANSSCPRMHVNDGLRCYACDEFWTGKQFAAKLMKKHNLVTCKHCKGKGLVAG